MPKGAKTRTWRSVRRTESGTGARSTEATAPLQCRGPGKRASGAMGRAHSGREQCHSRRHVEGHAGRRHRPAKKGAELNGTKEEVKGAQRLLPGSKPQSESNSASQRGRGRIECPIPRDAAESRARKPVRLSTNGVPTVLGVRPYSTDRASAEGEPEREDGVLTRPPGASGSGDRHADCDGPWPRAAPEAGAAPTRQAREASRNDPSPTRTGARSLRRSAPHPGGTPRRAARAWRRGAPWPRSAVTRVCRPWTRHTARARAGTSPRDGPRSRGCRLGRDGAAPVRGASAKTSAIPPSTS